MSSVLDSTPVLAINLANLIPEQDDMQTNGKKRINSAIAELASGTANPAIAAETARAKAVEALLIPGPGTVVSGHLVTFSGTTGLVVQDGGAVPPVVSATTPTATATAVTTSYLALVIGGVTYNVGLVTHS
ncbi:MAG TPA: hypothetical protein VNZ45_03060 [Bacteroidia bacterium]|jgi:hypothetical protein|nr:hypothetical protein [Bacteroidia bacterium]